MKKRLVIAALVLTVLMFASGYVVVFASSMIAMVLHLPGPYTQLPIGWLWLALHVVMLFGFSLVFCRWFARKLEKQGEVKIQQNDPDSSC